MERTWRSLVAIALAGCLALPACGGDDDENAGKGRLTEGIQPGGRVVELQTSDVDFIDPGRTYFGPGWQIAFATQLPLYRINDHHEVVPGLAESDPEISADGKTVTVRIRAGVRYAPPVNREVVADDVRYAFERGFSKTVVTPYSSYYPLVGAPSKPARLPPKISGIETPDRRTLVFHLSQPSAATFTAALALPITAPVPREYAQKFDRKNPSTYNRNVAFSGPYIVKSYKAGKTIDLVRNPNWKRELDPRPAYVDEVLIRTNATDTDVAVRQALAGSGQLSTHSPPASILRQLKTRYRDQYVSIPTPSYFFTPLNTSLKPLNDINVRKAIAAVTDREALRRFRGGAQIGELATHLLPPGFPGYEAAGGKGTDYDFLRSPNGNLALAQEYMKKAGYESGRYDGDVTMLMVADVAEPGKRESQALKAQIEQLGFKIRLRSLTAQTINEWCQVPARKVYICLGAWGADFDDPQAMLEPIFKSTSIRPAGNYNQSQLRDKHIDRLMDEAAKLTGKERADAWGRIDKEIMGLAAAVPTLWPRLNFVHSRDVTGVLNPYSGTWDLTQVARRAT